MSIGRVAATIGRSAAGAIAATGLLAGSAYAADSSPLPAATSAPGSGSTAVFTETTSLLAFALIFAFGFLVVLLVVLLVLNSERRYFTAVERIARLGGSTSPEAISATSGSGTALDVLALRSKALGLDLEELTISGSSTLTLGKPAEYSATPDASAAEAIWAVDPVDAAAVNPSKGAKVKVTPAKVGAFKLTATGSDGKTASLGIVVQAPAPSGSVLPFIGGEWGAMIVSVVIVTIVAVLGVAGVLGREGIATLFGALVGYLFGVRSSTGGSGSGNTGTTGGSGTTSGTGATGS